MYVNEVEISGVPNKPPAVVKKALKDKKERKKKLSLKKVMNNLPPIFAKYKAIYIDKRYANLTVISSKNMLLLQFFYL